MSWNPWKVAILLVAAVGTAVGSGVALSAGEGQKSAPARAEGEAVQKDANPFEPKAVPTRPPTAKQARTPGKRNASPTRPPVADEPGQADQSSPTPRNLPEGTFPAPKEVDAAASIRAAQKAYDEELKELRESRTSLRADLEILDTQIEVIKKQLSEFETLRLRQRNLEIPDGREDDPAIVHNRKVREQSDRHRAELTRLLKDTILSAEEVRARSDEAERRYQALRDRPRPSERVEVRVGDHILVEVLEALRGRPISGERFVRADGKISLGFYGDLYVAGMTTDEIKERVVHLLRKFLDDEVLGLMEFHPDTGKVVPVPPKDSNRVFVDIIEDQPARR